jgi:hypothetical protein
MTWEAIAALTGNVIAVIALLCSQFRPISEYLKRPRLCLSSPDSIFFQNRSGVIWAQLFVDMINQGTGSAAIAKIHCLILDEAGKRIWDLPAKSYTSFAGSAPYDLTLGTIALKPEQPWNQLVTCILTLSDADSETLDKLLADARQDLARKEQKLKQGLNPQGQQPVAWPMADLVIEPDLQRQAEAFFNHMPSFTKGNYKMFLAALAPDGQIFAVLGFEFTLFENHINTLTLTFEHFKHGIGYYMPVADHPLARPLYTIEVRLKSYRPAEQVRQDYERACQKLLPN